MIRAVKAAVAVTTFGLAAALAVPAQADVQYDTARYAPTDGLGEGAGVVGGNPLAGLLGGLTGGLLGGFLGGGRPSGQLTEAEQDAAIGAQGPSQAGAPNAAEDVTREGGPLPELSPIRGGVPLGGGGLTESLPVLSGPARVARPGPPSDPVASVGDVVASSVDKVSGDNRLLPDAGLAVADASTAAASTAAASTTRGAAEGMESLSTVTTVAGLAQAAKRALPATAKGDLSQVVGQPAPVEMTPVTGSLRGAAQTAGADVVTAVVEGASGAVSSKGTKAIGSSSDLVTALGWTTGALTGSVRDSWMHN